MRVIKSLLVGLGILSVLGCEKAKQTMAGWDSTTLASEISACSSDLGTGLYNVGEENSDAQDICSCYINAASRIHTLAVFQSPSNQEWQEERSLLNSCLGAAGKNLRFLVSLSRRNVAQEPPAGETKKEPVKTEPSKAPVTDHSEANTSRGTQRQRFQGRLREIINAQPKEAEQPVDSAVPPPPALPVTLVKKADDLAATLTVKDLLEALDQEQIREVQLSQDSGLGEKIYGNPGRDKYWDLFYDYVTVKILFKDGSVARLTLRTDPKKAHELYRQTILAKRPIPSKGSVTNYAPVALLKDLKAWAQLFDGRELKTEEGNHTYRETAESETKNGLVVFNVQRDKVVETRLGGKLRPKEALPADEK